MSTIVPFSRFGESPEEPLVTTMVHVETPPTWLGSGAQFFVTSTAGWNRFVDALADAVAEAPAPEYTAVTVFRSGSLSPAWTVRVSVADEQTPGANEAAKLAEMSPSNESFTDVRVTGNSPALQISMV